MSETAAKPKDVVTLDVKTNVFTTEGRGFVNQLNRVSRVLSLKETQLGFKGELLVKTGYVGEYKCVQLFKCPNGYFLFLEAAFGQKHGSIFGDNLDELLGKVADNVVKSRLVEEIAAASASAA